MFNRILVPLDGSKLAEQVFAYVMELAKAFGSEVILIEVCKPEESQYEHTCQIYLRTVAERLESNIRVGTGAAKVGQRLYRSTNGDAWSGPEPWSGRVYG